MKDSHFTRQERHVILWLRLLTAAFLGIGILFALQPNYALHYLDSVGLVFFGYPSRPVTHLPDPFWWILSLGFMGVLAYCSFVAQKNWIRYHHLVPVVFLAKGITAAGFGALIYFSPAHFFFIVAGAADGLLCFITAYAYLKAIQSRTFGAKLR